MNKSMKATTARTLLSVLLTIAILGSAAGFYVGLGYVRQKALEVTQASEDASAGNTKVTDLKALQGRLASAQSLVSKADTMFVPVADYRAKAVNDLTAYAAVAGVTITNTSFSEPAEGSGIGADSPNSGETRPVTITLAQPVSYAALMRFLQLTEGSLPKITVGSIGIRITTNRISDQVSVEPIILRVSVK
jgi:hypothetical protein